MNPEQTLTRGGVAVCRNLIVTGVPRSSGNALFASDMGDGVC
jgi:hypothetical protein